LHHWNQWYMKLHQMFNISFCLICKFYKVPTIHPWVVYVKSILYRECFKPVLGVYQVGNPCIYRLILVLVSKNPSSLVWSEAIPAWYQYLPGKNMRQYQLWKEQGCTSLTTRSIIVKNQPWNPNSRTRQVWKFQSKSNRYLC